MMKNNVISILIVIAILVCAGLVYNNTMNNAKNDEDKQLCLANQGLRGRYLGNIDCQKYDGNDYGGYAH